MVKKLLIFGLMFASTVIFAMEERETKAPEEKSTTVKESPFKAMVASYLDKLPIEIRKKIEDYLLFEKIPKEIKELIARALVDSVANWVEVPQVGEDLRNLSQVNQEFRSIVRSEDFTKYAIQSFLERIHLDPIKAAAYLATPEAAAWLRARNIRKVFINATLNNMITDVDNPIPVQKDNLLGIKFLFDVGATLDVKDYEGVALRPWHLLSKAVRSGNEKILRFLLSKDPDEEVKTRALIEVIENVRDEDRALKGVKILIESGANVNEMFKPGWVTTNLGHIRVRGRVTVLDLAYVRELTKIVRILEDAGAKPARVLESAGQEGKFSW